MRICVVWLAVLLSLLTPFAAAAQTRAPEDKSRANAALEQFKSLAGEWEGTDSHGRTIHISYEALSTGVVMERLQPAGEPSMMTMYSLDGDHILAIHFCSEGNQPILKTGPVSAATGKYQFEIERAYGLRSPEDLHMVALVISLPDSEHLVQAWTNENHGKRSTNTISLARKK